MTSEQKARCDALAKRIAELASNGAWAGSGMACGDHRSPWRKVRHGWYEESNGRLCSDNPLVIRRQLTVKQAGVTDGRGYELLALALAAGPDWRDDSTIGGLLMRYLPDSQMLQWSTGEWGCVGSEWRECPRGTTRTEAILAAVVASLEAAQSRVEKENER